MARISINGVTIDPIRQAPALASANLISADASKSNYLLIQTKGPLDKTQRDALSALGAEILEYVPDETYICQYKSSDLRQIRALPFVTWANTYLKEFKIPPIFRRTSGPTALSLAPASPPMSKEAVTVDIVLQKKSMTDSVRTKIAQAAGVDPSAINPNSDKVRLTVQLRNLDAIAAVDEVRHIEKYIPPQLANNIARQIMATDQAQASGTLQGEGQVVCVCDTGFDLGDPANAHPAFTGRVLKLYPLGHPASDDPNGHGTHVCGSVLGDGVARDGTIIRGSAPAAKLVVQSVLDSGGGLGGLPADLHDLFRPPYQNDGARVHSNSWGAPGSSGAYSSNSGEIDDFVAQNRDFVVCFAAGNDGKDTAGVGVVALGSVTSPGTAKNCIAVGASQNNRPTFSIPGLPSPTHYGDGWPNDFPVAPINPDPIGDSPEGMAPFSGRGPAMNNRIRPDIVAPGSPVLSTKSRAATGDGWAPFDDLFFFDGGTSMATPLVAGCAAIVRQFLMQANPASPSAALVKAMLINGAQAMHGHYPLPEVGTPPDNNQGFGRVNLAATVGPYPAGTTVTPTDEGPALDTGGVKTLQQPIAAGQSLKVTLVWTDPSGEALQNDLDLVITLPGGAVLHGNMPAGSSGFDRVNNVEQISALNLPAGTATISVQGFRCLSAQTYALVVRVS
jgi:serine protease AprX